MIIASGARAIVLPIVVLLVGWFRRWTTKKAPFTPCATACGVAFSSRSSGHCASMCVRRHLLCVSRGLTATFATPLCPIVVLWLDSTSGRPTMWGWSCSLGQASHYVKTDIRFFLKHMSDDMFADDDDGTDAEDTVVRLSVATWCPPLALLYVVAVVAPFLPCPALPLVSLNRCHIVNLRMVRGFPPGWLAGSYHQTSPNIRARGRSAVTKTTKPLFLAAVSSLFLTLKAAKAVYAGLRDHRDLTELIDVTIDHLKVRSSLIG